MNMSSEENKKELATGLTPKLTGMSVGAALPAKFQLNPGSKVSPLTSNLLTLGTSAASPETDAKKQNEDQEFTMRSFTASGSSGEGGDSPPSKDFVEKTKMAYLAGFQAASKLAQVASSSDGAKSDIDDFSRMLTDAKIEHQPATSTSSSMDMIADPPESLSMNLAEYSSNLSAYSKQNSSSGSIPQLVSSGSVLASSYTSVDSYSSAHTGTMLDAKTINGTESRSCSGISQSLAPSSSNINPPFPTKLYNILEDPSYQQCVQWLEDGSGFNIVDNDRFVKEVLPNHFRHTKLTSFQRQLNLYGFKRITKGVEAGAYKHPDFNRNDLDKIREMRRSKQKGNGNNSTSGGNSSTSTISARPRSQSFGGHRSGLPTRARSASMSQATTSSCRSSMKSSVSMIHLHHGALSANNNSSSSSANNNPIIRYRRSLSVPEFMEQKILGGDNNLAKSLSNAGNQLIEQHEFVAKEEKRSRSVSFDHTASTSNKASPPHDTTPDQFAEDLSYLDNNFDILEEDVDFSKLFEDEFRPVSL